MQIAGVARGHLTDHAQRHAGICTRACHVRRAQRVAVKGRVVESGHVDPGRHVLGGNQPVGLGETYRDWGQRLHGRQNSLARFVNGQESVGAGHCLRLPVLLPPRV